MASDPRQGDYLPGVRRLYLLSRRGWPRTRRTPLGVVILTQCCDLAREGKGDALAAAVVKLDGGDRAEALSGKSVRYAQLPWLGPEFFADLGTCGTIELLRISKLKRHMITDSQERHLLASRVARRFSRFAYPDEIQPFLKRLRGQIRQKARSETSPLGQCLERVRTIQVENESGWDQPPPWSINVVFVLVEGELPTRDADGSGRLPNSPSVTQIAEAIRALAPGSPQLVDLWPQLVLALVEDAARRDNGSLASATSEALEEGEFSYLRFRISTDIDVDDLSDD